MLFSDKITQRHGLNYFTFRSNVKLEALAFSNWAESEIQGDKENEDSDLERGRQKREGQAHDAFAWASEGLRGPSSLSPTQLFVHPDHNPSTLSPGTGCPFQWWTA